MTALVAIVGRPNVGKSTFFNRLVGGRPALVHDTPGLTRDRRYGEVDYFGRAIRIVDTGGLDPDAKSTVIGAGIHRQALAAIEEADAVLFVVDAKAGVAPRDRELAQQLRATNRPIFLVVNKVDHNTHDNLVHEFFSLGLGRPFAISATHGRGVDDLLDAVCAKLAIPQVFDAATDGDNPDAADRYPWGDAPDSGEDGEDAEHHDGEADGTDGFAADADEGDDAFAQHDNREDDPWGTATPDEDAPRNNEALLRRRMRDPNAPLRVAFVGRPNAGKSSLTNRLLGEERSLVHDEAGTTTDPVDTPFAIGSRNYILVDTAGIRKKPKIDAEIERIAVSMAISQIERADVVVLVVDAQLGASEQDARLLGMIEKAGRAVVIAMNKSDLVPQKSREEFTEQTKEVFHFVSWAPIVWLSAQRGDGVERLMDAVNQVAKEHERRVPTSQLNRFFADVCEVMPPPVWRGKSVRVYYLTQATVRPPTFVLSCSAPGGISPAYRRFLSNRLRQRYGFRGSPLRIIAREKNSKAAENARQRPLRPSARGGVRKVAAGGGRAGSSRAGGRPNSGRASGGRPGARSR